MKKEKALEKNDQSVPFTPCKPDQWYQMVIQQRGISHFRLASDSLDGFVVDTDTTSHRLTLTSLAPGLNGWFSKRLFRYQVTDDELRLVGVDDSDSIRTTFRRVNPGRYRLPIKGKRIHWISD